ncbi:transketolase-like [Sinocyclocheilus grahami]|uniref:transketolase-like n=1 Tax=Sinocyclocheilus grahami TaxID=75366 RepID=UPI0007AD10D6|nr:PREDICTED: transketolase-like [Sinocyclocheilus grahami]
MSYHKPDEKTLQALKDIANKLRIHSIKETCASNSGHPTSCCSAAELMSVLFFHTMRYKADDPRNPSNDRFILSKGHAAPILYAAWAEAGFIKESELLNLRKIDSDLEGHPTPKLAFVDVATGSLGQGLGASCGMAYTGKYFDKASYRVYCMLGKDISILSPHSRGLTCDLFSGIEDQVNWHGKPMPKDRAQELIKDLLSQIQSPNKPLHPHLPNEDAAPADLTPIHLLTAPEYKIGDKMSTRKAYGVALKKMGDASPRVVAMDGDTKNSTFSEIFKKAHPDRFIECFIAEQNMVSVAIGCATRDRTVSFASTFAAFFARAYDHIRMAAISQSNVNLVGSHCGVSIGEDGPSQMALEDLAMFRAIPTCTVFYPSDAVSTERAVELAANIKGICFIRTSRPDNAVIYDAGEKFEVGKAKVVRQSDKDQVTVIGAGVTLHEALAAHDQLAKEGMNIRIIDPFTIKPLDASTIVASARATGGRVITVEDHYKEGGLGEAVLSAVGEEPGIVVHRLAVSHVPQSGKPQELLDMFGISAKSIVTAVKHTFAN